MCDVISRHGCPPARRFIGRHRVEHLVGTAVVVLRVEEEDHERSLGLGIVEHDELRGGKPSGGPLSVISRCVSSIRSLLTPSKDTTRASCI